MRKITSLLTLLLLLVTGTATATVTQPTLTIDETNPTYYVLQNVRSGKYANYVGTSAQLTQVESASATVNTLWYFVANGDGVSIVPAADPTVKLASTSSATTDGAIWYTPENPYNAGTFCISLTSGATANCWDDQGGHTTIGYWYPSSNDYQGTSWNIVEVPVTKAQVDGGSVDLTFALSKLDVLARLAPLSSLSVYNDANIAAVKNAADETALNAALKNFETSISLYCRSGKYLVVGDAACSYVASPSGYEEAIMLESAGNGTFYLKGYKSDKYISQVRQSTAVATAATADATANNGVPFYFESYNGYTVVKDLTGGGYAYIHNGGSGCVGWEPSAANTQHSIAEVTLPAAMVNVTYHLMVGGVDKGQATVECGVGDAPAMPAALQYAYTAYTYDVPEITASTTDVYATATFDMPFTVSSDYDNAKWYYVHGHASYSDRYISTNGTATVWGQGKSSTDAYKWAFIGNPVDGITVINKASGDGYYLTNTDPATMSTTSMVWSLKKQTNTSYTNAGGNGFGLWDATKTYLNTQGSTLKYWSQFDQGSTYWVEEVPAIAVDVTFNLIVDGNVVNTVVQEDVAGNTTISVPASLTANYSSLGYTFSGNDDVNVGETDQTVNVTATLKAGVVTDLANLSSSKAYTLSTERGDLYIKNDHLASNSNANVGATAGKFALLIHDSNYYLYSVDASKFVLGDGSLSATPTDAIEILGLTAQTIKPLFLGKLGSNGLNVTNTNDDYELVINTYVTPDAGNRYCITEAEDFDATAALAALDYYFSAPAQYAQAITELKAIPFGTGLNQYSFTGSYANYTSQAATIIDGLETQGYTADNLTIAQELLANYALNMPYGKFIKLYNAARGAWIGAAATGKHPNASDADNAGIYFVTTDGQMVSYAYGKALQNAAGAPCVATNGTGGTFEFADAGNGNYYVKCGGYLVAWTSASDRLQAPDDYAKFTLTEVTELPLILTDVSTYGVNGYYTTMFLPVNVTVSGAKVYTVTDNVNNSLTVDELADGDVVPANTAVVLEGTSGSATATVTTTDGSATSVLTGTVYAIATTEAANPYVLSVANNTLGFYKFAGETLNGFRAFYNVPSNADPTRGFVLNFGETTTGISSAVLNGSDKAYDLQGRRVNNAQKGVFIINGKKVVK